MFGLLVGRRIPQSRRRKSRPRARCFLGSAWVRCTPAALGRPTCPVGGAELVPAKRSDCRPRRSYEPPRAGLLLPAPGSGCATGHAGGDQLHVLQRAERPGASGPSHAPCVQVALHGARLRRTRHRRAVGVPDGSERWQLRTATTKTSGARSCHPSAASVVAAPEIELAAGVRRTARRLASALAGRTGRATALRADDALPQRQAFLRDHRCWAGSGDGHCASVGRHRAARSTVVHRATRNRRRTSPGSPGSFGCCASSRSRDLHARVGGAHAYSFPRPATTAHPVPA